MCGWYWLVLRSRRRRSGEDAPFTDACVIGLRTLFWSDHDSGSYSCRVMPPHLDSTPLCIELVVVETNTQCVRDASDAGPGPQTGGPSLSSMHSQATALRVMMLMHLLKSAIRTRQYCHTYDLMLLHLSSLCGACEALAVPQGEPMLTEQEYVEIVARRPWYWATLGPLLPTGFARSSLVRCAVARALQAPELAGVRCEALSAILHSATVQTTAESSHWEHHRLTGVGSHDLLLWAASSCGSSRAFEALFEGVQRRLFLLWLLRCWDNLLLNNQALPATAGLARQFTASCAVVAARALQLASCGDAAVDTSVGCTAKQLQRRHRQHAEDAQWSTTEVGVVDQVQPLHRAAKRLCTADTWQPASSGGTDRTALSPMDVTMAVMCSQRATCSTFDGFSSADACFQRWYQHLLLDPAALAVALQVRAPFDPRFACYSDRSDLTQMAPGFRLCVRFRDPSGLWSSSACRRYGRCRFVASTPTRPLKRTWRFLRRYHTRTYSPGGCCISTLCGPQHRLYNHTSMSCIDDTLRT